MRRLLWLVPLVLAGCSSLRWYGSSRDPGNPDSTFPRKQAGPQFYSDLGPDSIDVSAYPESQRRAYVLYSKACSQCHGLARSINAPTVDRESWDFYLSGMRIQDFIRADASLSDGDLKSILEFLVYDSKIRKVERRQEFQERTLELQKQWIVLMMERDKAARPMLRKEPR